MKPNKKFNQVLKNIEKALLIILLIILPFFEGGSTNTGIMLWQTIVFFLIALKIIETVFIKNTKKPFNPFTILLLVIVLISLVHFLIAVNKFHSYLSLAIVLLSSALYILYISALSNNELRQLPYYFFPGFIIQVILGLYQFFDNPTAPVTGGFLSANYYSLYLLIGSFLMLGIILFREVPKYIRLISLISIGPIFALIMITKSRTSTGLFLLLLTLMLFIKNKKFVLIGIIAILMVIFIPNPYRSHIQSIHETDPYAYSRLEIYRMDLDIFTDHFLTGVGLGCFEDYSPAYAFPVKKVIGNYRSIPKQAHNSYLHWAIETGILGFVIMMIFLAIILNNIFVNLYHVYRSSNRKKPLIDPGASFALLSILIMCLLHNALHLNAIMIIFIILIGALQGNLLPEKKKVKNSSFSQILQYLKSKILFSVIIIFVFLGAWYLLIYMPWLSTIYLDKSIEHLDKNNYKEAIEDSTKCIKILPFSLPGLRTRGDVYFLTFRKTHDLDYAFLSYKDYNEAIRISGRDTTTRMNKIRLLTELYNYLKKKNPPFQLEDIDHEIVTTFEGIISIRPKQAFSYRDYALYLLRQNRWSEALPQLEKAIRLEPNFVSAHQMLAEVYKHFGNLERYESELETVRLIQQLYNSENYISDEYLYNLLK